MIEFSIKELYSISSHLIFIEIMGTGNDYDKGHNPPRNCFRVRYGCCVGSLAQLAYAYRQDDFCRQIDLLMGISVGADAAVLGLM